MKYTQLNDAYKFDVIADAVYARELEHFHYDFDRRNFEYLINTLPPGEYRLSIAKRLAETNAQIQNVEAIYASLIAQIDDKKAYAEAVKRSIKKREEMP